MLSGHCFCERWKDGDAQESSTINDQYICLACYVVEIRADERKKCAKIVNELMEEVRSKAMGMEYHLVLAENRIRDSQ